MIAVSLGKTSLTGMAAGHHWAVKVGSKWYEYTGTTPGMRSKCAMRMKLGATSTEGAGAHGRLVLVGATCKSEAEIVDFVSRYEIRHPEYCSISINCQKFAVEFIDWLTAGNYDITTMSSAGLGVHLCVATAFAGSTDSESRATCRLGHVAAEGTVISGKAEGPGVNAQYCTRKGAFLDMEACRVEASVGGVVGAAFCPNVSTGAGIRNGNLQAKLFGLGGGIGHDGLQLSTPLFELKLDPFGCLVGGAMSSSRAVENSASCFLFLFLDKSAVFSEELIDA